MSDWSSYVEGSAISSIERIDENQYVFNKYNRLELQRLDRESMTLTKVCQVDCRSGIVQIRTTHLEGIGKFVLLLTQDGRVAFYRHFCNDLEFVEDLRFPTDDGLAFSPSFIEATDECLLLAGYRGSMLLGPLCRPSSLSSGEPHVRSSLPSHTIDFDGVLLHARLVKVSQAMYIFSVTHNDSGEESGVVLYKVIENRKAEFLTSFKLPRGFLLPNILVQLNGGYFLLIEEDNGLLLRLEDTELVVKNQFVINTQPPSSYTEVPTLISAASNLFYTDFGDAFLASTNKGEVLCFEHKEGQFVISPVRLSDSDFPIKPVIASLRVSLDDDVVVAAGENMDGALMQYSRTKYALELIRPIPNWAPIIDVDSTRQKKGMVVASSGISGARGSLNQVRKGIRNQIISQTDQCFRGANRLWALKRYKSDKQHGFVAVSFTNSTTLFRLKELELEMVSACGLETACPTILLANLDTTSFWIQVCPDQVLVVKICEPDELNSPAASIWCPEKLLVSAATVIGNLVIILDDATGCIHFLNVACKISTGRTDISLVGSIKTGHHHGTALTACPVVHKSDTQLYLAASIDGRCDFWEVNCEDSVFSHDKLHSIQTPNPVNSIAFWSRCDQKFFAIGYRNGDAGFFEFGASRPAGFRKILETRIGDEPVKLVVVQDDQSDNQAICCTSRGVWFIAHAEKQGQLTKLQPEKFHPHVECFAEVQLNTGTKARTFLTTRKDTIAIIEADPRPSAWLYPLFSGPNLRRIMINDGTSLVSSVSDPTCPLGSQNSLELFNLSDLEALMRTKIPAHITSICPLSIPGLFAVATIDSNGKGAVHIYSCASFQEKDRSMKRKGSIADAKRLPSSFHFVAASSGFYSSVYSICEVLEGVLLVSCSTDVYLLKLDANEPSLQIFRSEPRRSPAYCMSAYPISEEAAKVAIYDEDGVEIIEIDMSSEKIFTHMRGDTVCRTGGKVAWINDRYILVTDKKGTVSIVDTQDASSVWLKAIKQYNTNDVPYSICRNPDKPNSLLIGSMLGAIYQFDLDALLKN